MALPISQSALLAGNDIAGLFSHFGELSGSMRYKECVRDELAFDAARRWPLLVEVRGIHADPIDLTK